MFDAVVCKRRCPACRKLWIILMCSLCSLCFLILRARPATILPAAAIVSQEPIRSANNTFWEYFDGHSMGHGIHKWVQYFPAYQRHFSRFIGQEVHIAEIGIQSGGSLGMWKSVFGPKAHVYGIDIEPKCRVYEEDQIKIFIGSQSNRSFWASFRKAVPRLDILIDDGGHAVDQMTITLTEILPHLSPEGIFITEDIHGSENRFWQALKLGSARVLEHVGSLHIYPYLLVAERPRSLARVASHLGRLSQHPAQLCWPGQPGEAASRAAVVLQGKLREEIPSLDLRNPSAVKAKVGDCLSGAMASHQANGLVMMLFGLTPGSISRTSLDEWKGDAGDFIASLFSELREFHYGDGTFVPRMSHMQQTIDSVHVYPQLVIMKHVDPSCASMVTALKHGTEWIPHRPAREIESDLQGGK
mmetsp:Transcript_85511/g.266117  ORF Transcript_85511/g.266117 Transcript_85511/m.266117 type:complete len:415 (+) Transcript_85511:90-1334(+)